jgi:hypothetical protein
MRKSFHAYDKQIRKKRVSLSYTSSRGERIFFLSIPHDFIGRGCDTVVNNLNELTWKLAVLQTIIDKVPVNPIIHFL